MILQIPFYSRKFAKLCQNPFLQGTLNENAKFKNMMEILSSSIH